MCRWVVARVSDNLEDAPPVRWFADDFETTTDLDSDPLPYRLSEL